MDFGVQFIADYDYDSEDKKETIPLLETEDDENAHTEFDNVVLKAFASTNLPLDLSRLVTFYLLDLPKGKKKATILLNQYPAWYVDDILQHGAYFLFNDFMKIKNKQNCCKFAVQQGTLLPFSRFWNDFGFALRLIETAVAEKKLNWLFLFFDEEDKRKIYLDFAIRECNKNGRLYLARHLIEHITASACICTLKKISTVIENLNDDSLKKYANRYFYKITKRLYFKRGDIRRCYSCAAFTFAECCRVVYNYNRQPPFRIEIKRHSTMDKFKAWCTGLLSCACIDQQNNT